MMLNSEQPLYVYELKGGVPPAFLDLEGLLGVWPEADYTYLFFTSPAEALLESFFQQHPEFSLTRHYQMPYGQWQQLAAQEPLIIDRFSIITRQDRSRSHLRIRPTSHYSGLLTSAVPALC
jgi:hypothetical protein